MKIYKQLFTQKEIDKLIKYKNLQPVNDVNLLEGKTKVNYRKINEHHPVSVFTRIVVPKVKELFPKFIIDHGTFQESFIPYGIHVDTNANMADAIQEYKQQELTSIDDFVFLVPLTQGEYMSTIFYDYFTNVVDHDKILQQFPIDNDEDFSQVDLSHLHGKSNTIAHRVPVETIYHWKVGDMIVWPREQLHCASNYLVKHEKKEMLVFFSI